MAVWFFDGFETNDFSAWDDTQVVGVDNSIATSSAQPKAGTYSAKAHIENAVLYDRARARKYSALDQGSGATIFASAWWFFPTGFDAEAYFDLMKVRQGASPYLGMIVRMNDSNQLYIRDLINNASYTQASPIAVSTNQHCGIELEIYVDDSAGYVKLWQDGVVIVSQTGIDTLPAANYESLEIGASEILGDWTGPDEFYFDEVYVQDTQKIPTQVVVPRFNPVNLRRFGGL